MFSVKAILTASVVLFSVIDIIGSMPIIIDLRQRGMKMHPTTSTIAAGVLMVSFLFFGSALLSLFGIEVSSFALAGSLIILFIGLEMVLGVRIFRDFDEAGQSGSIVPVAFPILAGAGTLTTIISLSADYSHHELVIAIAANLLLIFGILKSIGWIEKNMSVQVKNTLRKIFGILLIAIAIQMFKTNLVAV